MREKIRSPMPSYLFRIKWNRKFSKRTFFQVIEPINRLLDSVQFEAVFYSLDWHPPDHISFIDNLHLRPLHSSSPVSIYIRVKTCFSKILLIIWQIFSYLGIRRKCSSVRYSYICGTAGYGAEIVANALCTEYVGCRIE